ncbi:MAG: hypothetical protein ACXAD7_08390 [Candidatus Kariarchaeaceae archaeon]|jgi:hypothetical protein
MAFGIGHLVIGLSIVIPIYYFNKDKFHSQVAIIFVLNNWIGPDSAQAYFFLPYDFHYLIPFIFWAVPLASFYSYLTRFSIDFKDYTFDILDQKYRMLTWRQSYLLVLSGGLIHTFTDTLFRDNLRIKLLEHIWSPTLYDLHQWGQSDKGHESYQLIGYVLLLFAVFLLLYIFENSKENVLTFFLILITIEIFAVLLLGSNVVRNEYDLGVIFISLLFVFVPLMLLFYVIEDVHAHSLNMKPHEIDDVRPQQINRIASLSIVLAGLMLVLGLLGVLYPDNLRSSVDFNESFILLLGSIFLISGMIIAIAGIGLFFRINYARRIVMVFCSLLVLFVYPLVIVFYLAQDNVKAEF